MRNYSVQIILIAFFVTIAPSAHIGQASSRTGNNVDPGKRSSAYDYNMGRSIVVYSVDSPMPVINDDYAAPYDSGVGKRIVVYEVDSSPEHNVGDKKRTWDFDFGWPFMDLGMIKRLRTDAAPSKTIRRKKSSPPSALGKILPGGVAPVHPIGRKKRAPGGVAPVHPIAPPYDFGMGK